MTETKKKWIDKEWSKLIVGGIISLVVGVILIIITIIITPLPVGNILNGYLISLQRLINNILFYKFAVWGLLLTACSYCCYVLARRQNKINKKVSIEEIIKVPTEIDEPSIQPIKPKVRLATQPSRPVSSKIDSTPADKEVNIEEVLEYTALKEDGITYSWKWVVNPLLKTYEVQDFRPYCTNQKCAVKPLYVKKVVGGLGYYYRCAFCEQDYHTLTSPKQLKLKVEKRFNL